MAKKEWIPRCEYLNRDRNGRGELLDNRERVRDAAGPHRVPDAVYLGFQLASDHCCQFVNLLLRTQLKEVSFTIS